MRLRAGPAAAALFGAIGLAAPVRAQVVDGRASISLSGAYNKTLTDAQYPTAQTQSGPSVSIAPSGTLLIDTPLSNHTFTGSFSLAVPFTQSLQIVDTPLTYSTRLTYAGRYTLTDRSTLTAGLNFGYTPLTTLLGTGDPTQTPVDSLPVGAAYTLTLGVTEGFNRQISEAWSFSQSSSFSFTDPIDPLLIRGKTFSVSNALTASKKFNLDSLGLSATGSFNYFTASQGGTGQVTPDTTQVTDGLSLTWTHPWTEALSMNVNLGATQVISPAAATPTAVEPTGSVGLTYRFDVTSFTFSFTHQTAPNLVSGSIALTDSASLRFSVPFGTTGLSGSGSGGYTHAVPIGGNGTAPPGSPTNVVMGDVSLSYKPEFAQTLSVSTRAQLQRQEATQDPSSAYTRLAVSLSLTYSYPSASAAQTAPMFPPPLGMVSLMPDDITATDRREVEPEPEPPPATPAPPPTAP